MQIKVSSNQYDIVASSTVYLFEKEADLTMNIKADNGYTFSIVMKFEENSTKELSIQKDVQGTTIFLTCYNFNESGSGLSEPVQIAMVDGKPLYIIFWSYLDGNEKDQKQVRSVRYSLFY